MKQIISFFCVIICCSFLSVAQDFADKKYFLIDSLVLNELSEYDKEFLNNQLTSYHKKNSLDRLSHLDSIVGFAESDFLWKAYNQVYLKEASSEKKQHEKNSQKWREALRYFVSSNYYEGLKFEYAQELDSSLFYFYIVLDGYKKLGMNQEIGETMSKIAVAYAGKNNYFKAVDIANKSLAYLDTNEISSAFCFTNYASFQRNRKNYQEALYFQNKALNTSRNLHDYGNVILILSEMATIHRYQEKIDKADSLIKLAVIGMDTIVDLSPYYRLFVKDELGYILLKKNKLDTAQIVFKDILNEAKGADFRYIILDANLALAEIEILKGDFNKSKDYAEKAYKSASDYNLGELIGKSLLSLIAIAEHEENYKLALKYQKEYHKITNDNQATEKLRVSLKQAMQFQFDSQKEIDDLAYEKEIAIAEAQKQRNQIGMIAAGLITLIIAIASFFLYKRLKIIRQQKVELDNAYVLLEESKKNELTYSNLKALQSQMNPHFIFNALNSVQDLVLLQDIRSSNKYLGKFSDLIRKILLSSKNQFISLDEEIEILSLYLDLEKLRFGEDLIIDFNCEIFQLQP